MCALCLKANAIIFNAQAGQMFKGVCFKDMFNPEN